MLLICSDLVVWLSSSCDTYSFGFAERFWKIRPSKLIPVLKTIDRSKHMKHSVNRPPTPDEDVVDDLEKDELTLKEIINIKLVESGEKETLMELVRDRLVECGWKEEMRIACRDHVKKKGRKDVTVDELIRVITPKGRASVPDSVKAELLNRIQNFIVSAAL